MEIILLERVEKLGQMGDVVRVRSGYARNYLLPHRKALRATDENRATFASQQKQLEADNLKQREEAQQVAQKMKDLMVVIVRQASDSDQLYGSVTTKDIASTISTEGFSIRRQQVRLDRPIKNVGVHKIRIDLHPEVHVHIAANVARSKEEAKLQEKGEQVSKGDNDLISQKSSELSQSMMKLGEAAYKDMQENENQNQNQKEEEKEKQEKEDVVDADFEEVDDGKDKK